MSETEQTNEVERIRDILFGEQYSFLQERIEALETAISSVRRENAQLRKLLEMEVTAREDDIAKQTTALQEKLETDLQAERKARTQGESDQQTALTQLEQRTNEQMTAAAGNQSEQFDALTTKLDNAQTTLTETIAALEAKMVADQDDLLSHLITALTNHRQKHQASDA